MKISFANIEKAIKKKLSPKSSSHTSVHVEQYENDILRVVEKKNKDYVFYGVDNQAPYKLDELMNGSPIHSAIIKTKTLMTAGDGLLINGASNAEESLDNYSKLGKDKNEFDYLIKNPFGPCGFYEFLDKIALDYNKYGAFCFINRWNSDFSKIGSYEYVPIRDIRAGKAEEYYRGCWYERTPKYSEIAPFSLKDREHVDQLVYYKKGGLMYYGEPDYSGAIMWIQIDYDMGLFHLSNIENGMNPGLHWKFKTVPDSDNAKQELLDDIKKTYRGPKNTGNFIATFSSSDETSTEISPIESSTLDKQLVHLSELCDKKILSGHQLTSPLLAGISVSGQLGGNSELETAYKLFDNMVMEKSRQDVIKCLSKNLFNINIPNLKLDIAPYNPLKDKLVTKNDTALIDAINSLSPLVANEVLRSMSPEEIRGLIGLKGTYVAPTQNG